MKFSFIDSVKSTEENRIVAVKKVLPEDEYLKDHFPTFPIMPGVLKSVKYGAMVRPNDELTVDIEVKKHNEDGSVTLKGLGTVKKHDSNETLTAVSGRFTMRPATLN